MKSKLYIAAAVCLLLGACGGCREKCGDYYDYIPDPPRSYFLFPEGSWWAYENSVTGEIDTLTAGSIYGELYADTDLSEAHKGCIEGYKENQALGFNNGKIIRIRSITIRDDIVDINVGMSESFGTEYAIRCRLKPDITYSGVREFMLIRPDTIFSKHLGREVPAIRCINGNSISDTAWFSQNIGLVKFSKNDTVFRIFSFEN